MGRPWKIVNKHLQSQPSSAFSITHQGQCPRQVSLNLANPHFQGLTRFLSQGLLIGNNYTRSYFYRAGNNWSWVPVIGCLLGGVLGALVYVGFIEMHHDSRDNRETKVELESIISE